MPYTYFVDKWMSAQFTWFMETANSLTVTGREPAEASRLYDVLGDLLEHCFSNLHNIWKNLQFWQSRAEVSLLLPSPFNKLFYVYRDSRKEILVHLSLSFECLQKTHYQVYFQHATLDYHNDTLVVPPHASSIFHSI